MHTELTEQTQWHSPMSRDNLQYATHGCLQWHKSQQLHVFQSAATLLKVRWQLS